MSVYFEHKITTLVVGALLGATVTSCADKDFDWEAAKSQNPEYVFRSNFEKLVGEIDPNQSWDFSSVGKNGTRAEGDITPVVADDWYYVDPKTLDYYHNELKEGDNNKAKGKSFSITVPQTGFAIVPIYQGAAAFRWNLHMVVQEDGKEPQDILVWEEHRDLQCQLTDETIEFDHNPSHKLSLLDDKKKNFANMWLTRDGNNDDKVKFQNAFPESVLDSDLFRKGDVWYSTKQAFGLHDSHTEYLGGATWAPSETGKDGWWENYDCGWNTTLAKAIRSKFITFEGLPVGANVYFYLDVEHEVKEVWEKLSQESSLKGMMVALPDCPRPKNIDPKYEVLLIGCEDNSGDNSDWDMNDLGFMIIADRILMNEKVEETKRYMVEDLGSLAETDVDFNDIVVDFETYKTVSYNPIERTYEYGEEQQRAIFRAMGGTLDFTFYVGDTKVVRKKEIDGISIGQMLNTSGEIEYNEVYANIPLEGNPWKPEENNVWVKVMGRTMTDEQKKEQDIDDGITYGAIRKSMEEGKMMVSYIDGSTIVGFPEKGQTPFIIAFDPSKQWRYERQAICQGWLFDDEENCSHEKETVTYPTVSKE